MYFLPKFSIRKVTIMIKSRKLARWIGFSKGCKARMYMWCLEVGKQTFVIFFPVHKFIHRNTGFRPAQCRRIPEQKNSDMTHH